MISFIAPTTGLFEEECSYKQGFTHALNYSGPTALITFKKMNYFWFVSLNFYNQFYISNKTNL
jgi:hypothetical protein